MTFDPKCITLWSGVLPTKFGDHRALLSKLTPTWPQLTPTWSLTPAMHYGLVRYSSHQIWWPQGIPKEFDPWLTPDDPCMTFDPSSALRSGQEFYSPNLVAIGHSWTIWPLDDLWPVGSRRKVDGSPQLAKPYPRAKFQLRRLKHGGTHSETDKHGNFINIDMLT